MKKKTFVTGVICGIGLFVLGAATACSSDDSSSSSSGFSCPAVGEKNCPNDTPATQASVDSCNKCKAELTALASCAGTSSKPACGADGKSQTQAIPKDKCPNEQAKVLACYLGGSGTTDAGGGG